jgi:hypothetical protein
MNITIQPTNDQMEKWIAEYVPNKDIFFIREEELVKFEDYLHDILIIPRTEFSDHSSYAKVEFANCYRYWDISKDAKIVIVAHSDWITKLPVQKKQELFVIQEEVERGLVFPLALLSDPTVVPREYIVEGKESSSFVVQYAMWNALPYTMKEQVINEYTKQWYSWTGYAIPANIAPHLRKYANTFSTSEGSNCLAAVLFAITEQEWIIHEWIHPQTFMNGLKQAGYLIVDDEVRNGDVVVWKDVDGNVQHGSYCVGNQLFFNKNGQTIFNPWQIVQWEEVREEWKAYNMSVYRMAVRSEG